MLIGSMSFKSFLVIALVKDTGILFSGNLLQATVQAKAMFLSMAPKNIGLSTYEEVLSVVSQVSP